MESNRRSAEGLESNRRSTEGAEYDSQGQALSEAKRVAPGWKKGMTVKL